MKGKTEKNDTQNSFHFLSFSYRFILSLCDVCVRALMWVTVVFWKEREQQHIWEQNTENEIFLSLNR